jgi:hypothetical protein
MEKDSSFVAHVLEGGDEEENAGEKQRHVGPGAHPNQMNN